MDYKNGEAFEYDPLPENSIRLLQIVDSIDDPASHELRIQTVPLDAAPAFNALSYVWGSNADHLIYHSWCADRTTGYRGWLPTAPNLLGALPWLRVFSTLPLWIDAICINQQDTHEKSQQEALMGQLYTRAQQVIIWLGPAAHESDLAIDVLNWISDPDRWLDLEAYIADYGALIKIPQLGSFAEVLHAQKKDRISEWFRRLWTFQELKLARTAVVLCGGRSIAWSVFQDLGIKLYDTNLMAVGLADEFATGGLNSPKLAAQNLRALARSTDTAGRLLLDMINCSIGRECKLKEDRVYALLGLAPDMLKQKIHVAYGPDPDHYIGVYRHFARLLLEHSTKEVLDGIFLAAVACEKPSGMPSWCPNWAGMNKENPREGPGDAGSSLGETFHQPDPSKENILLVRGAKVDTVQEVIGDFVWDDEAVVFRATDVFGSLQNIFAWLNRCYQLTERTISGGSERHLQDYWCTICNLTSLDDASIVSLQVQHGLPPLIHLLNLVRGGGSFRWERLPSSLLKSIAGAIGHILGLWVNRVFFSTVQGRIGCATVGIRAGDGLYVIPGQPAVYCLRGDKEATSILTSRAFVEGLMEGQASQWLEPQDIVMLQIR